MEPYATSPNDTVPARSRAVDQGRVPRVHLFQIAYSAATAEDIEPGYAVIDNRANERPDWYEYWPIRRYLIETNLDEDAFYGFFSTKFGRKTALAHAEVAAFVEAQAERADVVLFSPQPDMGAFFLNVYEQAETFDPGVIDAFDAFLRAIESDISLRGLVMDTRHVVFSNYFVARPSFWRTWLTFNEKLFRICERGETRLREALCRPTTYPGGAERKVFLQERTASLLLATDARWRSIAYNPFGMGWSMSRLRDFPAEAVISDALKAAYRDRSFPEYLNAFAAIRTRLFPH